jgi:hypothetical protein
LLFIRKKINHGKLDAFFLIKHIVVVGKEEKTSLAIKIKFYSRKLQCLFVLSISNTYHNSINCIRMLSNTELFVAKSKMIHGGEYSYENADYVHADKNIIITCERHGDFRLTPKQHLLQRKGCRLCIGYRFLTSIRG